ncbi:hypothetical protein [Guptibacillus spartinae]|uniref:hypothetical protein n=1 Tax=Guptibacillus spartinae TaxID=3025679 RepID=UPI002361B4B1|nr:hypothetical protein [Pseudalkalibacillus spartinae]
MNNGLKRMILFNTSTSVVFTFVDLFVNLYIWQQNKQLLDLVWFNFFMFSLWSISYVSGSYLFYKKDLKTVMRAGSIFSLILFGLLSFVTFDEPFHWIMFAGSIYGLMRGVFSAGITLALSILGEGKEFKLFFQQSAFWRKAVNNFIPLTFAFILSTLNYGNTFIVMFIFSIGLFLLSFMLPDISPKKDRISNPFTKEIGLKKVFKGGKTKLLPYSYYFGGMFAEFQTIFLMYFTFTITEDKFFVALLNVFYTLLVFIMIKLFNASKLSPVSWMIIGILLAFLGLGLATTLSNLWLLVPNILLVIGNFIFRTNYYSQQYEQLEGEGKTKRIQITIWREVILCISRISFLTIIIILHAIDLFSIYILLSMIIFTTSIVPVIHNKFK